MLIVDAHLDLAWNALQWNRDLRLSAHTIRTLEVGVAGKGRAQGTVALPELRKGQVGICFATLLARSTGISLPHIDYASPEQACGVALGQLAYYRALASSSHVRVIDNAKELQGYVDAWQGDGQPELPLGIVISMESADPILRPEDLPQWYDSGVRIIGPAHYGPGRYAGGTGTESGLTAEGSALLHEMEGLGIILDLTHLSDRAFWESLDIFGGRVVASHNNCRMLVPHQRQFSDKQIRAIIERGGVIGAAFDAWMLKPGWIRGVSSNADVRLANVVDHIEHICEITGDSQHIGIGSDLDGGFGREQSPCDLDTIADLQRLPETLASRSFSDTDIAAILHANWLGSLAEAWDD